ncbi:CLUMA_CG018845, isoform A [Clunio marinus]|uniref:CLUMA_CG018845, isoform A n=1 Tax=Clunio marinus TaxID=568069 RepID=A0A1J1J1K2_9DIPT|nr:CLUMA_CG018845, isoform A [Clunio marinus]
MHNLHKMCVKYAENMHFYYKLLFVVPNQIEVKWEKFGLEIFPVCEILHDHHFISRFSKFVVSELGLFSWESQCFEVSTLMSYQVT